MKTLHFLFPTLALTVLLLFSFAGRGVASDATPAPAPAAAVASSGPADHVVTPSEIQTQIDQSIRTDAADRQAIRDLLARPDVRRVAGSAGLNLQRADAAVGTLSGPELTRLAAQARAADSRLAGGATITMTWTMVIIVVVALVVLIAIL